MKKLLPIVFFFISFTVSAQNNILCTNPVAEQVMLGNYDPAAYQASVMLDLPDTISRGIMGRVSPDSLHAYLEELRQFQNRNTGSDTVSATKGIGAARRWAYAKFQQFSMQNENRLIPSYLQFDRPICSMDQHRDVFAVLPGTDTTDKSIVLIEAHIDSRCADLCDTACLAEGMEDNGSGTALVLELARVMSRYSYKHTIVFLLVIAEEQGLYGAEAFAEYAQQKHIGIKMVQNNDIVGGIICGQTSSPPGCPGLNDIDSTHTRLFSYGGFNSAHKQLVRYIKLQYKEMILPFATVPMGINIMTDEDRTGRGSDHIPFRQLNYTAIRVCSANEHGDANVTAPGYNDRQHTSSDVLGVDTDNDMVPDSFFVDFNYLARNAVINGNSAGMGAISPRTPDFTLSSTGQNDLVINIITEQQYLHYRIGIRTTTNDWDSVYTFTGATSYTINTGAAGTYIVSVASVDDRGVESLFSNELMLKTGVQSTAAAQYGMELLQNTPNPADEKTMISVVVNGTVDAKNAYISITDLQGREVKRLPVQLHQGINEVIYEHGYNAAGTFMYSLIANGRVIDSKKMVFSN